MARTSFPRTMGPRSPLAGQRFTSEMAYMNARSQYFGFKSYADERKAKSNPLFATVAAQARFVGQSRNDSIATAKRILGDNPMGRGRPGLHVGSPQGQEMRRVIKAVIDEGLWDSGEDAADDIYYE
jgi:hypothetical protein